MNDGFRTLFRGYCEKLSKPNEARDQAIALICKARSDEAGMQTIRGDAGSVQTAGEFACEQDVAELRTTIRFGGAEAFLRLQIVEIQYCAVMGSGSSVDNACWLKLPAARADPR